MTNRLKDSRTRAQRRAHRVRSRFAGSSDRPRLHVNITNKHVSAQVIDDSSQSTIVASSTVGKKIDAKTMTDKAIWVGKDIAKKAQAKKVKTIVLDRGSRLYHGRIKALADAARESGMEF